MELPIHHKSARDVFSPLAELLTAACPVTHSNRPNMWAPEKLGCIIRDRQNTIIFYS